MGKQLKIEPLTRNTGAEISGLDLNRMDETTLDQLKQAWWKYKVLFIQDQQLDLEQLCTFSARLGELMQLPYITPVAGFPSVIRVLKEADEVNMGVFGGDWHSDFSFLDSPPMASILYGVEIPQTGGDTLWINMVQAWQQLPEELKQQLRGRRAVHAGAPYGVQHAPDVAEQFKGSIQIHRNNPEADREVLHPVVCRHPQTGEEMLFVNPTYTIRLEDMDAASSQQLLDRVYRHCMRPDFGCRFRWRSGTVAVWDNRNTLHYAVNDYDGYRRMMYRTTIAGHPPIAANTLQD